MIWEQYPRFDKRLLELEAEGLNSAEIARVMAEEFEQEFTRDQVKNRLARVPRAVLRDHPITEPMPYFRKYEGIIKGVESNPPKMNLKGYLESLKFGRKRALVLGDLHIPFQDEEKVQKAIDLGRACDVVIRTGDLADLYALSRFFKEYNVPVEVEVDGILRFNEYISRAFDVPVIDLQCNHHWRVAKAMQMPMSLDFLVRTDLLAELSKPFPSIFAHDDWWLCVNDTIFAHAETKTSVEAKAVTDTWLWFENHRREFHLPELKTLVQAHTHRLAALYRHGVKLFEGGALCKPMPYARRDVKYKHTQVQGCVVITWDNGMSNLELCREHYLSDA